MPVSIDWRSVRPGLVWTLAWLTLAGCDLSHDPLFNHGPSSDAGPRTKADAGDAAVWCPADMQMCGGRCSDVQTDALNCGGCDRPCRGGSLCVEGVCRCPAGQAPCNGVCVDLTSNAANCGGCGLSCRGGACVAGLCACPNGKTRCGASSMSIGTCIDTATDRDHCGRCGNPCPAGFVCVSSSCVCPSGQTPCNVQGRAVCANLSSDPNHCNGCGIRCPSGMVCAGASCRCPTGKTVCGATHDSAGQCVDLRVDPANCGVCGNVCGGMHTTSGVCSAGTCMLTCEPGWVDCLSIIPGCECPNACIAGVCICDGGPCM
jgi:hypothetical protein